MASVALNSAVRSNLRALQASTSLLNSTERRISTGKKVNSALDNPSSFFTAQALGRRAGDLNTLLDSVSNSVKTLQAADNGIGAISKVVEGLKATARAALQSPSAVATKSSVESSAAGLTAANLLAGGGGPAPSTVTGTVTGLTTNTTLASLGFSNSNQFALVTYGRSVTFPSPAASTIGDLIGIVNGFFPDVAASLTQDGRLKFDGATPTTFFRLTGDAAPFAGVGIAQGDYGVTSTPSQFTGKNLSFVDADGATKSVTFSASAGADNVDTLDELNGWLETNNVGLRASISGAGANTKLKFETTNANANATPPDLTGTATGTGGPFAAAKTFSAPVLNPAAVARRIAFVKDYNDALKQISSLAKDSSFNGVNLLSGDDLDVVFNENGSSKFGVKGTSFDASGIGLGALTDADFLDSDSINGVLDTIGGGFSKLEAQSSKFGSQLQIVQTRQSFTKDQVGTLQDGASALTDADTNEEAANLATLQTRQQLIVSSLSISTQQEQNILQLLR